MKKTGFTIIEMAITIVISTIIILAAATVMGSSQRGWNRLWNTIHSKTRSDSDNFGITFGAIGRKSNQKDYKLYKINNNSFTVATDNDGDGVILGDAVEFVYWDTAFEDASLETRQNLLASTGNRYALFYIDDSDLKVDYGINPPAIVNGNRKNPESTAIIAENIKTNEVEFSHENKGCIRAKIVFEEDQNNKEIEIVTSTFLRTKWSL